MTHDPTYENPNWRLRPEIVKPSVRNNTFVKFQRLYLYFRGRLIQRKYARYSRIMINVKSQTRRPKSCNNSCCEQDIGKVRTKRLVNSSIRLAVLEQTWVQPLKSCKYVIPSRGYNYFRFQSPSWSCLCLSKVALFNVRPLLCATQKTYVLCLEINRMTDILLLSEDGSYNCFWFRSRPRHHLSYLVSTCSKCCLFVFVDFLPSWARIRSLSIRNCLPSAIQP